MRTCYKYHPNVDLVMFIFLFYSAEPLPLWNYSTTTIQVFLNAGLIILIGLSMKL